MEESITLTREILDRCAERTDYFVETGTFYGGAVQIAIDAGFSDIRSVEIDPELFNYCFERFYDDLRVRLYFGDSLEQLPIMIKEISDPITFWLDAHAGNSATAGKIYAPLLQELDIIATHDVKSHIILIDDVRLFGHGFWTMISKEKVEYIIHKINPNYSIEYCDSKGYKNDILVAMV